MAHVREHGENLALMSDESVLGRLRVRLQRVRETQWQLETEKFHLTVTEAEALKRGLIRLEAIETEEAP